MDNQIGEIRRKIKALRILMLAAEDRVREQIGRDEDCSGTATQVLFMRADMNRLLNERTILGDREVIAVTFQPCRAR